MQQKLFLSFLMMIFLLTLAACGKSPVGINEIPTYPNAVELKAGDSRLATTLANNVAMDAAMRKAVGVGGKTEQRGFSVGKEVKWEAVKNFYDEKLKSGGWGDLPGAGGIATNILNQVNQQNDLFQTANYSRGKQNLSLMRVANPITKDVLLILSLTTNP